MRISDWSSDVCSSDLRNELCDGLYNVIDCSKVLFHVQTFPSFETVSMPLELDEAGEIINTTFAPGRSGALTVVRSLYRWRFVQISEVRRVGKACVSTCITMCWT